MSNIYRSIKPTIASLAIAGMLLMPTASFASGSGAGTLGPVAVAAVGGVLQTCSVDADCISMVSDVSGITTVMTCQGIDSTTRLGKCWPNGALIYPTIIPGTKPPGP